MKRTLSLILAAALVICAVFTLSACGSPKTDISGAKSLADLANTRISAQSGIFHEDARTQIEGVKGSLYPSFSDMLVALKSGAIDGYIAEEPTALAVCLKDPTLGYIKLKNNDTGFTASDEDVAIAIGCAKGSALIGQINEVLATITDQQKTALMEQIVQISSDKNTQSIDSFAISNATPTAPNGTLKVAMECAYDPFNWTQTSDANGAVPIASAGAAGRYANGYDVQIAKYVANALGMSLENHMTKWDSLVPGVESGVYDAIIAGMSPTAERKEKIDFSSIYYTSNLVIVYQK